MRPINPGESPPGPRIAIIDHDMGNRASVNNAFREVGAEPFITRDFDELRGASGIVLPGVGAFPAAMDRLRSYGLDKELDRARLEGKPILGICLGHQLLFEASEEHEYTEGLGFLPGVVRKSGPINIGWRRVTFTRETRLNAGLSKRDFYHLHSYAVQPEDESIVFAQSPHPLTKNDEEIATAVSGVQSDNLYGVQFHPEKSSRQPGLEMIKNFVQISSEAGS